MKNFKKFKLLSIGLISSIGVMAQQPPTNNNPSGNAGGLSNKKFWARTGNNNINSNNNIFGTMWNSPIYTYTAGTNRGIRNGDRTPTINGFNVNTSGFMGIGPNSIGNGHQNGLWTDIGPFSLLHLNGVTAPGDFVFPGGYRPWMRTGITFSDQIDLGYIGIRSVDVPNNINEFVINWSNDPNVGQYGPDDMVFRFSAGNANTASTISTNLATNNDLDGLHIARFTGTGEFGLGNTFGAGNPIYVRPASLQHLSLSNMRSVFTQYTNRRTAINSGTRETASDGFRIGILGKPQNNKNGNALIYNQENRHILFSTNQNTTGPGGVNLGNGNTGERMRITNIGAPTNLAGGGYGVNNPAGLNGNITRVSISRNPNQPVTRPLSLLHLGFNTGAVGGGTFDGWRTWMDIGTFTGNGTDNMYVGLKQETGAFPLNDRNDAVISWGDNGGTNPLNGPDNLRFIFTETQTSIVPGNAPATSLNGLEVARMVPNKASTIATASPNFGMMGIGDYAPSGPNTAPADVVDAKLDIDGDLRIRQVTKDTNNSKLVLVIDSTDHNRVHWLDLDSLSGNVTANNGVSVNANGVVQLGVPCTDSLGNPDTTNIYANAFTKDRVVANRDFNFWFGSLNNETGGVGVGGQPTATTFCNTGNTFEISANAKNTKYGNTNASGLRLTKLTSGDTIVPNGINGVDNSKVLSVDSLGDVVLVDAVGGGGGGGATAFNGTSIDIPSGQVQLGNDVGLTTAALINDREIPMNTFNTYFTGQGLNTPLTDNIYVGYPTTNLSPIMSKFSVIENVGNVNQPTFAGHFRNINIGTGVATEIIGVAGISDTSQAMLVGVRNIGGYFNAKNAPFNYGVIGTSSGNASVNYGVYGSASGAVTSRAGFFNGDVEVINGTYLSDQMFKTNVNGIKGATDILRKLKPHTYNMDTINFPQFNFESRLQYGFIAQEVDGVLPTLVHESYMPSVLDSLGNEIHPAVNYKSLNYNAIIPITVQAVNEITTKLGISTLSDQTVKTNVQNLSGSLAKVKQMRGVSYEWNSAAQSSMGLDSIAHIGFIAQEIAAIEPLLTFVDDSSLVHVNYDRVAPLLVESVKELDAKNLAQDSLIQFLDSINNDLKDRLTLLENCVSEANICNNQNRIGNNGDDEGKVVELENLNAIILDQNLPNPFAEKTTINYIIPEDVMEAHLLFYDMNGRIINQVDITERGEGKLTVYGENLQNGIYTYSLIADGKLIATKKMVKQ